MSTNLLYAKVTEYTGYLREEERSGNTITKYLRDLEAYFRHLGDEEANKETLLRWKEKLAENHAPTSVNSMLAAVNGFFDWLGFPGYKVKPLKIQRAIFAKPEKELTKAEYGRLVETAKKQRKERLSLLLQTVCATGIRISELRFITVESTKTGRAAVNCKGKNRVVFLPKELCKSLQRYCRERKLTGGTIFRTALGAPLDRSNIWRDMKGLCKAAHVEAGKVFPHNLRHLFARVYYAMEKDLSKLADLLGHANIATTRVYTMESGSTHIQQLDHMGLVAENNKDHITRVM